jgi:hypothetical protein
MIRKSVCKGVLQRLQHATARRFSARRCPVFVSVHGLDVASLSYSRRYIGVSGRSHRSHRGHQPVLKKPRRIGVWAVCLSILAGNGNGTSLCRQFI